MSRVKARDTVPEMMVRKALHAAGLRYRLHAKGLPGRPDLVFPSRRVVVFVHGCFWHRHPDPACKLTRTPKSRLEFWETKFSENTERDARNLAALEASGWTVFTVWECQVRGGGAALADLVDAIKAIPQSRLRR